MFPMRFFALITTFPINFSPVGEIHPASLAYIAALRHFFHVALTMLFDITVFARLSYTFFGYRPMYSKSHISKI